MGTRVVSVAQIPDVPDVPDAKRKTDGTDFF